MAHNVIWSNDTCQCILEIDVGVNPNVFYVNWIQKCAIHESLSGQNLVNQCLTHNRLFEIQGNTPQDHINNNSDKKNERARIRAIGAPVVNP